MKYKYIVIVILAFSFKLNAQTIVNSTSVNSYDTAPEGDLFMDENSDHYIGQQNGSLKMIGNVKNITSLDNSVIITESNDVFDLKLSPSGGDNDNANELQTLSKSGITTTLSNGGGVVNEIVTSISQSTNTGVITC